MQPEEYALSNQTFTDQPIRVVGLVGSLRTESYTRMAVNIALRGAADMKAHTQLLDLKDYDLVFANGKVDDKHAPPEVLRLRQDVRAAQGIILGTPEYHGSFSGVLKNALDLMGFEEFEGKMIGLVGVSGGRMGALNALNGLRTVGRWLHAWVIPEQVSIAEAWRVFDSKGNLQDHHLEKALLNVGKQVTRFAYLHSSEQIRDFLRDWEAAPPNPGGYEQVQLAETE
jgi:NAD(P)H-dependent FMN reductase